MFYDPSSSRRSRIDFSDTKSRTQRSDKDSCDLKLIIKRAKSSGVFPAPVTPPRYGNGIYPDFQTAQNVVAYARQNFEALPARLREKFHNDAMFFADFACDQANYDELVKLGISVDHLVKPEPVASPPGAAAAGSADKA